MLSVLIPIYNWDVTTLVTSLHKQCVDLAINFEIICVDDASPKHIQLTNKAIITSLANCRYEDLPQNIGRSAIRNLLANKAQYNLLLFLDCDSALANEHFISNYITYYKQTSTSVIYGGRIYTNQKPAEKEKHLRWLYGKQREEIAAEQRRQNPHLYFLTNNFLIEKNTFLSNPLDESMKGYGHEDTLFAQQLKQKQIAIAHIDNPTIHIGLEDAQEFLEKTQQGLSNLYKLYQKDAQLVSEVKIIKTLALLKKLKLSYICFILLNSVSNIMKRNLLSSKPSLFLFDLYKLKELLDKTQQ